jgi:Tol biopolymer transport system component
VLGAEEAGSYLDCAMRRRALLLVLCVGMTCGFSAHSQTQARSQDSSEILLVLGADYDEPAGPLAVVRADGSGFRRLTRRSVLEARWSPDGRRIAFIDAPDSAPLSSVWVMNADGRSRRQLVPQAFPYGRVVEWSPDGRRILYDRGAVLWSMRADGRDKRRLLRARRILATEADWSPDGSSIAFTNGDNVYVMRADGSGLLRLAKGGVSPEWTADGTTILFVRQWLAPRPGVYAVPAVGGQPQRLASLPKGDGTYLAGISPDGRSVLVGQYPGLALVSLHGEPLRRLTRQEGEYGGDWSPDGTRIAFLRGPNLWIMDADGGNAKLVRRAPGTRVFTLAKWRPGS